MNHPFFMCAILALYAQLLAAYPNRIDHHIPNNPGHIIAMLIGLHSGEIAAESKTNNYPHYIEKKIKNKPLKWIKSARTNKKTTPHR